MKRIVFILVVVCAFAVNAQNRWSVYGGGSISHLCEKPFGLDEGYGWGGGAFFGAAYEINFTSHWGLSPQVEIDYINNGANLSDIRISETACHLNWRDSWNVTIPVLASFRFPLSDNVRLKIAAGPYIQEAFAVRQYKTDSSEKEKCSGGFSDKFNFGTLEEISVETGNHFSYMFRVQYPFLKENWSRKTLTLSLGVKYTF